MRRATPIPPPQPSTKPTIAVAPAVKVEVMNARCTPQKYNKTVPERMLEMAKLGLTLAEMAHAMEVGVKTVEKWTESRPGVREAVDAGRWIFDTGMELNMQQRAMGYDYLETRTVAGVDSLGREYSSVTTTTRHVPGDPNLMIYWQKLRQPQRWFDASKDGNTTNIMNVNMNKTLKLDSLSAEERSMLESVAFKQIEEMNGIE